MFSTFKVPAVNILCYLLRKLGNALHSKRVDSWNVASVSEHSPLQKGFCISTESYIQWKTFTEMWGISSTTYKVPGAVNHSLNLSSEEKINLLNKLKFLFAFSKPHGFFPPSRREGNQERLRCGSLQQCPYHIQQPEESRILGSKFIYWNVFEFYVPLCLLC